MNIISSAHLSVDKGEVVLVSTELFECLRKESDDIISNLQDLREEKK